MNKITEFFCRIGGGEIDILKELPTEQNRFFGYGTVIMMTAIFATLSSGYAFSLILYDEIGWGIILPALVWGAFILIIDRFFIVSLSNKGGFFGRFFKALPRLLLALFIGVIISKPIEFRIFEREISDKLAETKEVEGFKNDEEYKLKVAGINEEKELEIQNLPGGLGIKPLREKIDKLEAQLPAKEAAVEAQSKKVNCECNGACGTGIVGRGPACKHEEREHARLLREKNTLERDIRNAEAEIKQIRDDLKDEIENEIDPKYDELIAELEVERKEKKEEFDENYKPSILNQQIALGQIQNDSTKPTAFWTVWFITGLFIFIEMAPMVLKLMTKAGAYENRIAQIEATYSTDGRLRRSLDMEEYKSNRGLVRRLARSQRGIINKAMELWFKEQMDRLKNDPDYYRKLFSENREENDENNQDDEEKNRGNKKNDDDDDRNGYDKDFFN